MGRSFEDSDPLTIAMRPPADETPTERAARQQAELEASKVSQAIDEQISKERAALKKKKRPVKVLLLGQSESGKSTTLKNFQLTYAGQAWAEERSSWRDVVRLNLIRNVNTILDHLSAELTQPGSVSTPLVAPPGTSLDDDAASMISLPIAGPPLEFSEKHRLLKLRLGPLRGVQKDLERRLGAASIDYEDFGALAGGLGGAGPDGAENGAGGGDGSGSGVPFQANADPAEPKVYQARSPGEFFVRSNNGWKTALDKLLVRGPGRRDADDGDDEVSDVVAGCREDMRTLWKDEIVQEMLKRRKIRMEDAPGFFLEDVDRIAARNYEPTDGDVVRARLRTLGVQEHRFVFERGLGFNAGRTAGQEWLLYDVGGHRSSRAAWGPYFDDVDAIIFLAPISAFDEKLAEDRRVNRLEDSYLLWKSISSSKLLARTQIILFLNKCDLLEKKLQSGVRVRDHVPSFGERTNDAQTAAKYFQHHFKEIAKNANPEPRPFYVHLTSVVDTKATAATLAVVEEGILRDHLQKANLL